MKKLSHSLLARFTLVTLLLFNSIAASAEQPPIRVGLFNMPPFYSQNDAGNAEGMLIDTLNQVMKRLGYRWKAEFMPVPQALKNVIHGKVDLLMIIRHPMVEGKAIYGRKPMDSMNLLAFHRSQHPDVSDIKGLRDRRVALIRGYGYGGLLNQLLAPGNGIQIRIAEDHTDAFQQLAAGRADYVLDYLKPGNQTIRELGFSDILSSQVQKKDIYFVVSRHMARGEELMEELERAMDSVRQQQASN